MLLLCRCSLVDVCLCLCLCVCDGVERARPTNRERDKERMGGVELTRKGFG